MVINIKKILLFLCLFFLFNTLEIDSNSDKVVIYDKVNLYDESVFKIYFDNVSSYELDSVLSNLNIRVLSYIIDEKRYYARSTRELMENYTKDLSINEKIFYDRYGLNIDGINAVCNNLDLIKLEELINIY